MPRTNGCNHLALVTNDLERFLDFYISVFDADVLYDLAEGPLRHALVDLGGGFALHPFWFTEGSQQATASPEMFQRGHLDHVALNVDDAAAFEDLRHRLVDAGASDGTVTDFGCIRVVVFTDPDGMQGEIGLWVDAPMRTFDERGIELYEMASSALSR